MPLHDPTLASSLPPAFRPALRAQSLGEALRKSGVLDEGGAAIVVAGERAGFLPRSLRLAADAIESARKRRTRALFALAYPAFLVVAAGCILPLPLLFTAGAGGGTAAYLKTAAPFIVVTIALFVAAFTLGPRLPVARVPIIGMVVVEDARAACLEILGALIAAGAPMSVALPASLQASGLFKQATLAGETLTDTLRARNVVDDARAGRLAIAEKTGTLDKALPALAKESRERAQSRFTALAVVMGLVCFGAVAVGIGASIVRGAGSYLQQIEDATKE